MSAGLLGLLLGWLYYRIRSLGVCMAVHALHNASAFVAVRWAPAAWQKDLPLEGFGSGWWYAGAVGLSAAVLAAVLWRVQQTTSLPVWVPGEPAGDSVSVAGLDVAAV